MRRLKGIFLGFLIPTIAILTIFSLASSLTMKDCVATVVFTGIPLGLLIGFVATNEV